jgi:nitrogen regulatory protein PII
MFNRERVILIKEYPEAANPSFLADSMVENATTAVVKAAKTGKIGDGKVFVYAVEEAIRYGRTKQARKRYR